MRKTTYGEMEKQLINILNDLSILSGDILGPSGVSWQYVAGTTMVNLRVLANQIEQARLGNCESIITFPSPKECVWEVCKGNIDRSRQNRNSC